MAECRHKKKDWCPHSGCEYLPEMNRLEAEIEHYKILNPDMERMKILEQELQSARKLIDECVEKIEWMSGSPSFAPEGEAHQGWLKVQEFLARIAAWKKGVSE